jgi:hypothetical protein
MRKWIVLGLATVTLAGTGLQTAHALPPQNPTGEPIIVPKTPPKPLPPPPADPVGAALTAFQNSTQAGLWPKLSKTTILSELRARVNNPFRVSQGSKPLCGPAAIVFELARRNPARYIYYCRDLFERGTLYGYRHSVSASAHLRNSRVASTMSQVDWMLMATLRESENWIIGNELDADSGTVAMGVTTPGEMVEWTENILGCRNVDHERSLIFGEVDALREGRDAVAAGGVAFLLIDTDLLPDQGNPILSIPEHWVSLLGNVTINEGHWDWTWTGPHYRYGHMKFDVYSWATSYPIDVGEKRFENDMFGVVTGRF